MFDLEDVVRSIPPDGSMEGRIAVAAGSFFDGVPAGADIYLLIRVLHDWRDEDCLRILRACRAAMGPEALLLIGEQILEPDPARGSADRLPARHADDGDVRQRARADRG